MTVDFSQNSRPAAASTDSAALNRNCFDFLFAAMLVVISPWIGFNFARFDDPTFVSTND